MAMNLAVLSDASAVFFLWLFVTAGLHKLKPANGEYFTALFGDYGLSTNRPKLLLVLTKLTGALELSIGLAIIIPASRSIAAIAACGILLSYLTMMALQLRQGRRDLDCGCAGPGSQLKISGHLLGRNALLAVSCLFCLSPGLSLGLSPDLSSVFITLCLAVIAVLVNLCCDQLIRNAQHIQAMRA